ncbi:hypothetical protein BCV69DRAFT_198880 [Microstroma glucosiphilum]|uniref:GATA-type domain-containing protein n=1 Tax=Pseudomicrostroma glucosiphilum TaxID=1684307 RepID=A0A316U8G6_9BASI|nr:hypothetical protein BCV69DRAFT_198880 [Pseudomicrostroma glucosiphilum]PWN20761.1 hypothetical protein BCV69DRAFT_198880 [Pseudomicrostroma glucosiphilum]
MSSRLPGYSPASSSSASANLARSPPNRQSGHGSEGHPRPYRGRSTPFPIPVGKRTVGGLAAVDEHGGADMLSQLFGEGKAQPAALGKTRCYWALFSTESGPSNPYDLTFIFCDPVLQNHLNTEADLIIGKSFFDYVHPEQKEQARSDLAQIVASGTLFGSVTRCRYFRVPAIREHLGCKKAVRVLGSALVCEDDDFLTLDIVLNMVGESLALCFFHAIINKSVQDNDEANKTDWTNWCGTPRALFDVEQCNKLWASAATIPRALSPQTPTASHVFQILSLSADESPPEIIFSWPPARFYPDDNPSGQYPNATTEAYEDGSYFADEFARLAQGVQTSPSARTETGHTARNGEPGTIQDGANTSCTRRFRAKHTLTTEGMLRSVESVLVPYGTILLACFKTKYQQIMNRSYGGSLGEFSTSSTSAQASSSTSSSPSVRHGFIGAFAPSSHVPRSVDGSHSGGKPGSVLGSSRSRGSGDGQWSDVGSPWSMDTARERLGGNGDSGVAGTSSSIPIVAPQGAARYTDDDSEASSPQRHAEEVPPLQKKQKKRMRQSEPGSDAVAGPSRTVDNEATKAQSDGAAEANKRCSSCGTANSPEWRKGPTGHKTLCNACGLRFSRSINRQQKKAEKERAKGLAAGKTHAHVHVLEDDAEEDSKSALAGLRAVAGKGRGGDPFNAASLADPAPPFYSKPKSHAQQPQYTPPAGEGYGTHTAHQIDSMGWGPPPGAYAHHAEPLHLPPHHGSAHGQRDRDPFRPPSPQYLHASGAHPGREDVPASARSGSGSSGSGSGRHNGGVRPSVGAGEGRA